MGCELPPRDPREKEWAWRCTAPMERLRFKAGETVVTLRGLPDLRGLKESLCPRLGRTLIASFADAADSAIVTLS